MHQWSNGICSKADMKRFKLPTAFLFAKETLAKEKYIKAGNSLQRGFDSRLVHLFLSL